MHGHHPCCMGSGIGRVGMPMVGARTGITFSYLHKISVKFMEIGIGISYGEFTMMII